MGRRAMLDPLIFPPGLRELVSLPVNASMSEYKAMFEVLETNELKMALKILTDKYPGQLMDRKSRIRAEINRRSRMMKKVGYENANLPRLEHWNEDFPRIWNETCEPIRRAINESRNKKLRNRVIENNHSRRY